jgi:2,5-diketo-D-gluconate reductase B
MDVLTGHGMKMPKLGLGTWRMKGDACRDAVERAIKLGFRHIDTAEMYGNEEAVGAAIESSGKRADIHLTTKVWYENLAPDALLRSFERSLAALRVSYVDLYLIHWPAPVMDLPATLKAMEALQKDGRARAIGVSNFPVALMRQAVEQEGAPIACNQVEYHVLLGQTNVLDYARSHGIVVTAYAPLAQGRLAEYADLTRIAEKHGVSAAQVALKWLLDQDGVAAIPKAERAESQIANMKALDLALDDEDRAVIAALPKDQRMVNPGFGPKWD